MECVLKLIKAIENLGQNEAISHAIAITAEIGVDWNNGIGFVFSVIAKDPSRIPNIGANSDDENTVIRKWILKYQKGLENRASVRISNPPGTIPDPIVEEIIAACLTQLKSDDLNKITYAHRLGMSAENILGLLLEEYLAINLKNHGWHCAWGETIKSVDFVNESGRLLQIKNRSNSENSSSSKIRYGTLIEKWYRIRADRLEYMWDSINSICETNHLSEISFVNFVKETLSSNPNALAVETNNPWGMT